MVRLPNNGVVACMREDKYRANHGYTKALADCLIFWSRSGTDKAFALELKGVEPDINHALKQLANGAAVIDELSTGFAVDFLAGLVCPELGPFEIRALGRRPIVFRGKPQFARRIPPGTAIETL